MWQVDFKKLIMWLTPTFMRKSNLLLLLLACNYPIRQKYDDFLRFVDDKQYRLNHNSQVCYLRAVLNDAFDFTQRRIRIVDFDGLQRVYVWSEEDKLDIDSSITFYVWPDDAYGDSGVDFTVQVPNGIATSESDLARIKSLLNEYKTPGKKYNIVRI